MRRNPLITRCLYYSKDVESFGTGLKRIKTACDQSKVRIDFKRLKSGFAVVFYRSGRGSDADIAQVPRRMLETILEFCVVPRSRTEIQDYIGIKHREYFRKNVLAPLIKEGFVEPTIPEKPTSSRQKYVTCR